VSSPEAELRATVAGFAAPVADGDTEPPPCAFPARFRWLDQRLHFDRDRLPAFECTAYDEWRRAVGPAVAASLVFADAFLNNPSSMFGHTLIRFDAVPIAPDVERRDLLAYAVNFAADTGDDRGVLYAVRGIVGSYSGYYSLLPYYAKVRQYSDIESRDIWEYPLALSEAQVEPSSCTSGS
jgi:hypothetical protein